MEQSDVGKCKYGQNIDKRRQMGINCMSHGANVWMFEEYVMQTTC